MSSTPRSVVLRLDAIRTASRGLTGNRLRTLLAGLGIAIGIAAIVTVIGLSASSREDLLSQLDRIGSNLLTATPGAGLDGRTVTFPSYAAQAVAGIDGVSGSASVSKIEGATVRRTPFVPVEDTSGVSVVATSSHLDSTLDLRFLAGAALNATSADTPSVVLGSVAARRLGAKPGEQLYIADQWFTVVGVLRPVVLDPNIDSSALIGARFAQRVLEKGTTPTQLYARTKDGQLDSVRALLGPTAVPQSPAAILVTRPTEAIAARLATEDTFNGLFVGLGAVALLIGGVGVANVMVISVLERRNEIGLRRALGATRKHIAVQFMLEALALSLAGGLAGCLLGIGGIAAVATGRGWAPVVPVLTVAASAGASVLIGIIAGAYPAIRASRLAPTEALRQS